MEHDSAVVEAIRRHLAAGSSSRTAAMVDVVAETSSLALTNLDRWERTIRAELWLAERHPTLSHWKVWSRAAHQDSWLHLCSGDGYRRERALLGLSEGVPNSFSFSLVLRRLNDWVPQVRAAARERLKAIAERSDPTHIADALWCTFPHWSSWGRMEPVDRAAILGLTSFEQVAHILKLRILSAAAGPAAQVLSQAGRAPALDEWLVEFAEAAVEPSVRARAYQFLLEGRVLWVAGRRWVWTEIQWCKGRDEPILEERRLPQSNNVLNLLHAAVADRSPLVRRVAADFVVQRRDSLGVDALDLARRLSADSSSYVALRGRFALTKLVATHE